MQRIALNFLGAAAASLLVAGAACSASNSGKSSTGAGGEGGGDAGNGGGGSSVNGSTTSTVDPGVGGSFTVSATSTGSGPVTCDQDPTADADKDGFTENDGDCNDCDPNVNPAALEVLAEPGPDGKTPEPADEDCDGTIDNVITACDDGLAINGSAEDAAKAIDICTKGDAVKPGLLEAAFVRANGSTAKAGKSAGILGKFGDVLKPRNGQRLLGLSSGYARDDNGSDGCGASTCPTLGQGKAPTGFPQDVPGCDGAKNINDDIALQVKLRAPKNATGYAFDFNFMSFEYPEFVCSSYNDQFITLVDPAPKDSINGNISFDSKKNPVSVNIAFFEVCKGCKLGTSELNGTGFDVWDDEEKQAVCLLFTGNPNCKCTDIGAQPGCDEAGGTSWLETRAPVEPGSEVTIRFAIWDTGDQQLDSTVLIDHFRWIANGGTVQTGTQPVPK